jgi:hypothetical protein
MPAGRSAMGPSCRENRRRETAGVEGLTEFPNFNNLAALRVEKPSAYFRIFPPKSSHRLKLKSFVRSAVILS